MKKVFVLLTILQIFLLPVFSEKYKIKDYTFDIEGTGLKFLGATRDFEILKLYPIDTQREFKSEEEVNKYIDNYKIKLESTRFFETIDITYTSNPADDNVNEITLNIKLKDSHHMIVMPYPSYSSSKGLSLTIKAKDTNFLGTLKPLNADIKIKLKDGAFTPSFSLSYDYPFKAGIFDLTLLNEYGVSYTKSEAVSGFEWNTKTGLNVALQKNKVTYNIGFIQKTNGKLDFQDYGDYSYFTENFYIKTPVNLYEFPNFTTLVYTPSLTYNWNWDQNGINIENDSITSPEIIAEHKLSNKKIIWNNNFRKGYDFEINNSITYNFQRNDLIPFISFESKLYWNYTTNDQEYWNRYGICADFYTFTYIDLPMNHYKYGENIGERLRGINDYSFLGNTKPAFTTSSAIMLSIDLPHNILTTNFKKEILNFNLQISPFFDFALVYNRTTDRLFHPYDGYYCGGIEVLLYPLKWSSLTIRASLGVDLKAAVQCSNFLEGISKSKELFIGIGLQY